MQNRAILTVGLLVVASLIGCSSQTVDKESKRAEDRTAMRLSDAELKRDQYKTQLDKTQADLADAQKKVSQSMQDTVLLRKQVQDLQQSNTTLSTQIEQLRNDLSRSNVAKAAATDNKQ
jgi:septal ring factor EnvC (AmiA/AmiB activator)